MINIFYKPTFVRQYKKLPQALKEEVKDKIAIFRENPHHHLLKTHKLQGKLKGFYSFSVNYEYRIIFQYETENNVSFFVIGDHSVYK